jgi:PIN domain nuclease of toxin-antitoxin system
MDLLIDTHAFLWFVLNDAQLSVPAKTSPEAFKRPHPADSCSPCL